MTKLKEDAEAERGILTWHSSEEDGGPDCGVALGLGDGRILWCGEISRQRHAEAGEEAAALGSDFGWWIILYSGETSQVIAKCVNAYVARDMLHALSTSILCGNEE